MAEMYESQVTVTPPGAPAVDGKRTPGAPVSLQVHIETKVRVIRNQAGEEVTAAGRVFHTDVLPWINEKCTLALPGRSAVIVAVETTYGYNIETETHGPYQTITYFGA